MTSDEALAALRRRLMMLGGLSALMLALFVVADFDLLTDGYAQLGFWGTAHEFADHLLFPIAVAYLPVAAASILTTARTLAQLDQAVARLQIATSNPRGVRLTTQEMPLPAHPFVHAVNRLLERLDAAALRHEAFAADVAHEIKSSLTRLTLESERLAEPAARDMSAEIRRVNRLVEQLLTLAQLDAYVTARQTEQSVALRSVADAVVAECARRARAAGVALHVEAFADPVITGRPELLAAGVRNLVENAIRVTDAGGTVRIRVGPGNEIAVADEGPGIPPGRLMELCDRFRRADRASEEGAGLGLSIVSRIAESLGARLTSDEARRELALCFRNPSLPQSGSIGEMSGSCQQHAI